MSQSRLLDRARAHWLDLTARLALPAAAFDSLVAAYGEAHRRYHSLDHVVEMLDGLAESRHLAARPDTVALAVWYHDAIYAPDAPTGANERASAAWLAADYAGPESVAAQDIILHSTHHGPSDDPDTQLFCDLDLYRLGVGYAAFEAHSQAIRAEYAMFDHAAWTTGRSKFLRAMRRRAPIYQTAFWRDRLEARARDNLDRALAALDAA